MTAPFLAYATPSAAPRTWRGAVFRALLLGVAALAIWQAGSAAWREFRLRSEASALLAANAPAQMWQSADDIALDADGTLILPSGRMGRLAEMRPPRAGLTVRAGTALPQPEPGAALSDALARLRADRVGCTVTGAAPDGLPMVQIWARSPRACYGMCGNSSRAERRRGAMRLWRNVGVHMAERGDIDGTDHAWQSPVSVIGF